MPPYPRSQQQYLSVERTPVNGKCSECGGMDIQQYPVVAEGGWWKVTKCQGCLRSLARERIGRLGSITLLSDLL